MDQIWTLLFIGYGIGFIIIAYFGITGVNEIIEFKNRQHRLSKSFERNKKQMEFDFDK
tara:strand:+ start:257 stop:430 length:174 start_codon:yes stop_codon:yes gene_type:complete